MTHGINSNILLAITLNIAITTAASYLISPAIDENILVPILSQYYGLSIVALIFCYIFMQFNKASIVNAFDKVLILNLLFTNFLLLFLKYPLTNPIPINILINSVFITPILTLAIAFNMVLPSVTAVILLIAIFIENINKHLYKIIGIYIFILIFVIMISAFSYANNLTLYTSLISLLIPVFILIAAAFSDM